MIRRVVITMLITGAGLLMHAGPAEAHMRDYLFNQPYYTAKQGEFEVEVWTDYHLVDLDNNDTHTFRQQYEFEYGLTNRLQVAYYEVIKWDRRDDWERDMMKLEAKYRLAESGEWPVDVALYAEYKNPNGHRQRTSDELEGKLILSKDLGPWNVIGNLILERKINRRDFWDISYTAGVSYPVSPTVRLGLELKETLGDTDAFGIHRKDHKAQLLPGIYANLTPHVRILVGPAIGLTKASDNLQLRSLVEIEF